MRVLLVDDHTLVLRGLAQVLQECVPDSVVTPVASAAAAIATLEREPHDVALVDIRMPDRDGLELMKEIRERWPDTPVIVLTSFDNGEYVKRALAEGAAGYLLKDSTPEDLAQAITVARSGAGNVLSPRAIQNLFNGTAQAAEHDNERRHADGGITRREWDILNLLSEGHSNREISRRLFLSEKTVKAHLAAVFRKLGVSNRTQAAMAAVAMGAGPPTTSSRAV